MGGSYWELEEVEALLQSSGFVIIHAQLDEWIQTAYTPDGEEKKVLRSFYRTAAQKQ
jgi:hypothetical protein